MKIIYIIFLVHSTSGKPSNPSIRPIITLQSLVGDVRD